MGVVPAATTGKGMVLMKCAFGLHVEQAVFHLPIVLEAERDVHVGVLRAEVGYGLGHQPLPDAGAGHHMQKAAPALGQVVRQFIDALHACIDVLDLAKQPLGLGRGVQPALDALEQREADLRFGVRQQPAHGRLRDMQGLRGATDGTRGHDGAKDFDLAQVECHRVPFRLRRCYGLPTN
jgi:hypothetical protein